MKERTLIGGFLLLCLLFLAGCQADSDFDAISKAQRIEIADAATGEHIRTLESEEEIEAFVNALTRDVRWKFQDPPEGAVKAGAFTLYQNETIHPGNTAPRTLELCTLYSYGNAPYLSIATGLGDVSFAIPQETADYLHTLLS